MGDNVLTQHTRVMVSLASGVRGLVLAGAFVVTACAGRQYGDVAAEPAAVLQFDNQATTYADVYLVAGQIQWRLGRVPAGMRQSLTVPETVIAWPTGLMQLVVIPGSLMTAEASRDPRAILANAQSVSEVLSQRWSFRQPAGVALQLQATRIRRRE